MEVMQTNEKFKVEQVGPTVVVLPMPPSQTFVVRVDPKSKEAAKVVGDGIIDDSIQPGGQALYHTRRKRFGLFGPFVWKRKEY